MKTLQTILGSLALAGAVAVPASGQISKSDSLDSILQGRNILIDAPSNELVQKADDKEAYQKIFNDFKGKSFRVTQSIVYTSGEKEEVKAIYEFPEKMSEPIKLHDKEKFGFTSKGRSYNRYAFGYDLKDEGKTIYMGAIKNSDTRQTLFFIGLDENKKHKFLCGSYDAKKDVLGLHDNITINFKEISKDEYAEVEKYRKGIVGKYKAKKMYTVKNNKKFEFEIDVSKDYVLVNEKEMIITKTDLETDRPVKTKLYLDEKVHKPLEVEFNDKGEMIYNPSKYKNPYKTFYDFNISNNEFFYHSAIEVLKVTPKDHTELFDTIKSTITISEKIVPVLEPDGTMELHVYKKTVDKNDEYVDHLFILEKVK